MTDDDEYRRKMKLARKDSGPRDLFMAALPAVITTAPPHSTAEQIAARTEQIARACWLKSSEWLW